MAVAGGLLVYGESFVGADHVGRVGKCRAPQHFLPTLTYRAVRESDNIKSVIEDTDIYIGFYYSIRNIVL